MWSWNFDTVNKAVINISCCGDERRGEERRDTNIPARRIRNYITVAGLCLS